MSAHLAVALLALGLQLYIDRWFAREAVMPPRTSFAGFPSELEDGWHCRSPQRMDAAVERELGVSDYLLCDFRRAESPDVVGVYIGYHATQVREDGGGSENSIHPPAHCLPGSGWSIVQNETVPLPFAVAGIESPPAKRLVIAKGQQRNLVYYWYQSRGRVEAEDWRKILSVGIDRALRQRTDGALVRFTIPLQTPDNEPAEATFRALATRIVQRLDAYVPL